MIFHRSSAWALCMMLFCAGQPLQAANILFTGGARVADDTEPLLGADQAIVDHLNALGHTVTYSAGDFIFLSDVEEANPPFDLYIMSSTSATSTIRPNELNLTTVPILTWESSMARAAVGEMYISEGQTSADFISKSMQITDAGRSHPILAGIDVPADGLLEVFKTEQSQFSLTGAIAEGATIIGIGDAADPLLPGEGNCPEEWPDGTFNTTPCGIPDDRTGIVTFEPGDITLPSDGSFADDKSPGRRVFIAISDTSFAELNDVGLQLFDNAVNYAINGPATDPLAPLDNGTLTDPSARAAYVHDTLKTWIGDSNLDHVFNSSDLVDVFTAGQYEDGVAGNSTWATGDWNGDGEFSSSDFVAAFSDGGYEQGPRAAVSAVPEPSSLSLLLVGVLGFRRKSRVR